MPTLTLFAEPLLAALPDGNHTFGSVALALIGIGLLIFIHELGHFLACRLTKTRVETFSMGFGPRLMGFEVLGGVRRFTLGSRRSPASAGSLDVRLSAIPLGGYVKMAGEIGGDGSPGAAGERRAPRPDEFPAKPFLAKAFIISAGVIMNVIMAVALFAVAYGAGMDEIPPVVGAVSPGGAAWSAGLMAGDRIESFGGTHIRSFDAFRQEVVYASSSGTPDIVVTRKGESLTFPLKPRYDEDAGLQTAGVQPVAEWTVDDGKSAKWTIGQTDRASVDGRPVVGGRGAAILAWEAWSLGKNAVHIDLERVKSGAPPGSAGDISSHDVVLPSFTPDAKPDSKPKLGVALAPPLVVDQVRPGSAAQKAGLRAGDRIVAANGAPVDRAAQLDLLASLVRMTVKRDGKDVSIEAEAATGEATSAFFDGIALRAKSATKAPAIVVPDGRSFADGQSPATAAGIVAGEEIVEIGGKAIASWDDLQAAVKELEPKPVAVKVKAADGAVREVQVTPKAPVDSSKADEFFQGASRLVLPKEPVPVSGAGEALSLAAGRVVLEVKNIFRMIGRFFGGEISPAKNLGGPGTIVNLSSRMAHEGVAAFLAFIAFISVNLAVLNILPIPVLDGGSLFLLIVEKVRGGRPIKETTIAYLQWAGFALLMLLMVFAIKNDFGNLSH